MPERDQMMVEILTYFLRRPDAEDSLEGIAAWRQVEPAVMRAVLDDAVKRQLLVMRRTPNGGTLYRVNEGKAEEARRLIGHLPGNVSG